LKYSIFADYNVAYMQFRKYCMVELLYLGVMPVLVIACSGCHKHEGPAQAKAVEVSVISVTPRDVPVTFKFVARIESSRQVNIQARVNGFLDKRVYTEGAVVKEGETLFLMDQKPFIVQLDQAKAALARQEAALDVATKNLARVKPLSAAHALSQKDLDDATGMFEYAGAAVEQAKAEVEQAKLNLSYTVITSPVDGFSGHALQADGTYISPSNSLLTTVALISPVYVNFSLSENEQLRLQDEVAKGLIIEPNNKAYIAEVILADGTVFGKTGQITFASPYFDARTGTFLIRATVENPDGLLRPNQYVHIRIKGAIRPNAILVPQRAVQESSKGQFVWVVDKESKAEQRPVVVGDWYGNDWFIYQGLRAGDQVVVEGMLMLRPGIMVKATPAAEKPEETQSGE
jgi:membrane fusion protein (multidrug efflux system)